MIPDLSDHTPDIWTALGFAGKPADAFIASEPADDFRVTPAPFSTAFHADLGFAGAGMAALNTCTAIIEVSTVFGYYFALVKNGRLLASSPRNYKGVRPDLGRLELPVWVVEIVILGEQTLPFNEA